MRRSPEVLIARLRNRKARTIGCSILSVACLGLLAMNMLVLSEMISGLIRREGGDLPISAVAGQQVLAIAGLQSITLLLALGLGVAAAALITELSGATKADLLVQLWDCVQTLERSKAVPANSRQPHGLAAPDHPAADGYRNRFVCGKQRATSNACLLRRCADGCTVKQTHR
jgi:hypothetical protein